MEDDDSDGFGPEETVSARRRRIGAGPEVYQLNSSTSSGMRVAVPVCKSLSSLDVAMNTAWNALVNNAQCQSTTTAFKMPWETGYAASIFGKRQPLQGFQQVVFSAKHLPMLVQATSLPETDDHRGRALQRLEQPGVWPIIARRMHEVAWRDSEEVSREVALQRLKMFMLSDPNCSGLGQTLMADILCLQGDEAIQRTIADIFVNKATATLKKRSKDLSKCNRTST